MLSLSGVGASPIVVSLRLIMDVPASSTFRGTTSIFCYAGAKTIINFELGLTVAVVM